MSEIYGVRVAVHSLVAVTAGAALAICLASMGLLALVSGVACKHLSGFRHTWNTARLLHLLCMANLAEPLAYAAVRRVAAAYRCIHGPDRLRRLAVSCMQAPPSVWVSDSSERNYQATGPLLSKACSPEQSSGRRLLDVLSSSRFLGTVSSLHLFNLALCLLLYIATKEHRDSLARHAGARPACLQGAHLCKCSCTPSH